MEKEFKNGIILSMYNQWEQLIVSKFNWSTFQFLLLAYEFDKWMGAHVFQICIFGFALNLRIPRPTKTSITNHKEIKASLDRLHNGFDIWIHVDDLERLKDKATVGHFLGLNKKRPKLHKNYRKVFIQ